LRILEYIARQIYKMCRNVQYIVVIQYNLVYMPDKPCRGKDIMVLETIRDETATIYIYIYVDIVPCSYSKFT